MTGEGIAFAMESGFSAALAALRHLREDPERTAYDFYLPAYAEISQPISRSNRYRLLLFPKIAEYFFVRAFPDAGTLQHGYMDLLADEITYRQIPRLLMK